jgi:hypothetical protein
MSLNTSSDEPASNARITISLQNIPLMEAVKYVTSLANLKYRIRPEGIEVGTWPDADSLVLRKFKINPRAVAAKGLKPTEDVKQFLAGLGVSFPEGGAVAIVGEDRLIVKARQEDVDLVAAWLADQPSSKSGSPAAATSPPPRRARRQGRQHFADAAKASNYLYSKSRIPRRFGPGSCRFP